MVQKTESLLSGCNPIAKIKHTTKRYCQLNDIQTAQPINGFIPLLSGHDLGARHLCLANYEFVP